MTKATIGVVEVQSFRGVIDHQGVFDLFDDRALAYRLVAGVQFKDGPKNDTPDDRHGALLAFDWQITPSDTLIFDFESTNERGNDVSSLKWKEPEDMFSKPDQTLESFPSDRRFNPKPSYDNEEIWTYRILAEYRRQLGNNVNIQLNYEHGVRQFESQFTTFEKLRRTEEVFGGESRYNPHTDEVRVGYQRRRQEHTTDGFNGNLFAKFDFVGVSNEFLVGGTVYTERFALLTETVAEPRVTRSGLKFFPPAHLTMTVNELETFDFSGKAEAEPDEDNNNLADLKWVLGEDTNRTFRNKGFYLTNTTVLFNNRLRLMAGTRYDFLEQGQTSVRLIQTKQGDIFSRDIQQKASQNAWTIQFAAMVNVRKNLGYYISQSDSIVQQFLAVRERNVPPALAVPAKPLEGEGWETGIKFGLFKKHLNGTIAYFQSVELNRAKNTGTDRFGSYQRVAKSQEVEGVEMDIVFQPVPNWQTMISGAYLNALENALNPTDPAFDRFTPAPAVPQWQGRMFSKLSFTEGPLRNFEVGVGLEAVDDSRTEPKSVRAGGDPEVDNENLKQFYVWDLMLAYSWSSESYDWRVQLNIDNLLDRRYFPGGNTWGLPRWGELALQVRF